MTFKTKPCDIYAVYIKSIDLYQAKQRKKLCKLINALFPTDLHLFYILNLHRVRIIKVGTVFLIRINQSASLYSRRKKNKKRKKYSPIYTKSFKRENLK